MNTARRLTHEDLERLRTLEEFIYDGFILSQSEYDELNELLNLENAAFISGDYPNLNTASETFNMLRNFG